ncbi:MAG TPA: TolC family protein [Candidatus Acidoferrum sp.]|nr:TolC family protein [Candidatus Acidoferrum sp.]
MRLAFVLGPLLLAAPALVLAQQNPPGQQNPPAPTKENTQAAAPAMPPRPAPGAPPSARISIDEALRLAVQHNHALLAARTTILQNQALETTANLRPNPTLSWDAQFLPIFEPSKFSSDYLDSQAQFDLGFGYTFEIGGKRQHRFRAARDVTEATRSTVADNERQLTFNVGQQFVAAVLAQSQVDFTQQDLESFQKTVDISELQYKAGAISEGDLLKIKLQMLQFQNDVLSAKLAKIQALSALRQLLGFESVADDYDVDGKLEYVQVHAGLDDLKALALRTRPDLRAAQQNVTAAQSAEQLAVVDRKRDLTTTFNYSHVASTNTGALFFTLQLPFFDRNQGEIARTRHVITQNQQLASETGQQVLTDVVNAYQGLRTSEQIVQLYEGGYVDQATKSRDISEYAYKRGAASLLDFLDAERTYRSNQLAYRQALATYMTALEQMRQATGTRNLP